MHQILYLFPIKFIFLLFYLDIQRLICIKLFTTFSWECRDSRFYIRQALPVASPVAPAYPASCLWYQNYTQVPANLQCLLHHCSSPQSGESSFPQPPTDNQLRLVLTAETNASLVALGSYVSYTCAPGTFIESNETDPSRNQVNI